ncbi:DMT family transporter [Fertoebacter nigrum]|uniref:DMT family transporter n=1 Tax=Fertoeibacter niger TaxID=2656921 RepID=A0A8X8H4R9_9RHOB|nr:DMT family transporter [Fertoeibacter niger]NUB46364.1 DMT family transporter [Fertoeibacter niger]
MIPGPQRTVLIGILCAVAGSAVFSINDLAIKALSSDYALHQVILTRSLISLCCLALIIWLTGTGFAQLRTRRRGPHLLRVGFVLVSNVTYFLGLAALPLADAVAIAFVSPLLVTGLSVIFLGEKVGPRRWAAVAVGLLGVIIMLRPGAGAIQPAAILVLISALTYAAANMMTRHMRVTESAFAMNFYVQLGFIVVSTAMGLTVGNGSLAGAADPSLAFLFRAWIWPPVADWPAFLATGMSVAVGGLLISQAYRTVEAAVVAPFEYTAMPLAIFWGVVVFGTWPDLTAAFGIALICGAGLYTAWRETAKKKERLA